MGEYKLRMVEVTGDVDEETYELMTPKAAVPGAVAGHDLTGEKVEIGDGRTLLIISAPPPGAHGGFAIPVLEIEGDVAEDDLRLVMSKAEVPEHLGEDLTATLVGPPTGWLLISVLPRE